MAAKISADTPVIVQALMEQLARSNAENSALQCKLTAERMISSQIFAAMEAIDPSFQDAVLKSLRGIALELEHKSGKLTGLSTPLTVTSPTTLGLLIIAACIQQFSVKYKVSSPAESHLHLVVDNQNPCS
jgi:hypothetical protein